MEKSLPRRSLIAGMSAVLARPSLARTAPRIIKVGHAGLDTTQFGQGLAAFSQAVAGHPDLGAVIMIEVHGHGEFGDEGPMLADCQAGTLDMVACATSAATGFCPDIGILDIPFVYRDVERGRATIDGLVGEEYATLLAAARVPVIAWLENGLRHFTANRPIRTPADLAGLKLRVMPSPSAIDSFRSLGADARPLPYKQLYEALRVGQFEAQENPLVNVETMRLYEVQKYLCLSAHTYGIGVLVASADLAEELTPQQLAALRDCGRAATRVSRKAANEADETGAARLHQQGMTIIADVDTAAFVKAARANLDILSRRFTSGRMQRVIEAAG